MTVTDSWIDLPQRGARIDAGSFLAHAVRVDPAAVVRVQPRAGGLLELWVSSGFDVLVTRVVPGESSGVLVVAADAVLAEIRERLETGGRIDPGFPLASAWRGSVPRAAGFAHLDDVPARTLVDLARRGVAAANDVAGGAPTSLLDQPVLTVSDDDSGGGDSAEVPLRAVFACTAMAFVRTASGGEIGETTPLAEIDRNEVVRVRASAAWLRLDARFGSVCARRGTLAVAVG